MLEQWPLTSTLCEVKGSTTKFVTRSGLFWIPSTPEPIMSSHGWTDVHWPRICTKFSIVSTRLLTHSPPRPTSSMRVWLGLDPALAMKTLQFPDPIYNMIIPNTKPRGSTLGASNPKSQTLKSEDFAARACVRMCQQRPYTVNSQPHPHALLRSCLHVRVLSLRFRG